MTRLALSLLFTREKEMKHAILAALAILMFATTTVAADSISLQTTDDGWWHTTFKNGPQLSVKHPDSPSGRWELRVYAPTPFLVDVNGTRFYSVGYRASPIPEATYVASFPVSTPTPAVIPLVLTQQQRTMPEVAINRSGDRWVIDVRSEGNLVTVNVDGNQVFAAGAPAERLWGSCTASGRQFDWQWFPEVRRLQPSEPDRLEVNRLHPNSVVRCNVQASGQGFVVDAAAQRFDVPAGVPWFWEFPAGDFQVGFLATMK